MLTRRVPRAVLDRLSDWSTGEKISTADWWMLESHEKSDTTHISGKHENWSGEDDVKELEDEVAHLTLASWM